MKLSGQALRAIIRHRRDIGIAFYDTKEKQEGSNKIGFTQELRQIFSQLYIPF